MSPARSLTTTKDGSSQSLAQLACFMALIAKLLWIGVMIGTLRLALTMTLACLRTCRSILSVASTMSRQHLLKVLLFLNKYLLKLRYRVDQDMKQDLLRLLLKFLWEVLLKFLLTFLLEFLLKFLNRLLLKFLNKILTQQPPLKRLQTMAVILALTQALTNKLLLKFLNKILTQQAPLKHLQTMAVSLALTQALTMTVALSES